MRLGATEVDEVSVGSGELEEDSECFNDTEAVGLSGTADGVTNIAAVNVADDDGVIKAEWVMVAAELCVRATIDSEGVLDTLAGSLLEDDHGVGDTCDCDEETSGEGVEDSIDGGDEGKHRVMLSLLPSVHFLLVQVF